MNGFMGAWGLAVVAALAVAAPAAADPAQIGSWSALQTYPVNPVSMGVTPDGKIVAWDQANQGPYFGPVPANGPAMVLDPTTGTITRSINVAPTTIFCSLITSLPDGRVAIIGGGSGSAETAKVQIYDGDSQTFSVAGEMERTRWYPGGDIDARGNVLVAGGTNRGIEKVDATTGLGTLVNTTFPTNWYPDLIRMPDGRFTIEDVGDNVSGSGAGPGRYLLSGTSLTTISNSTLLKARRRGIRTMIAPYRFFYNSGGTSTESMIVDVSSGTPKYTPAASSQFRHMTGQAVTLPTGDVLAVGGNSTGQDTIGTPVLTPELYSPTANAWTTMATLARQRQYHSVSALLPDGRVWSAGTSYNGAQEPNGQFFSPPYLFKHDGSGQLAPRPSATDAPSVVKWGETFSVATGDPANIASASLIRLAATTHQLNAGQAYVPLSVTPNGGRVQMTTPAGNVTPAGYYMLFLVDRNGVPSVAPILRVKPDDESAIPPRVTQSSQLGRAWGASEAFDGNASLTSGAAGSVSQTQPETQPWWDVDLGSSRDLESLTIRTSHRSRYRGTRPLGLRIRPAVPFGVRGRAARPVRGDRGAGADADRLGRHSDASAHRPLLRVQLPGSGSSLSLAEVVPNPRVAPPPPPSPHGPDAERHRRVGARGSTSAGTTRRTRPATRSSAAPRRPSPRRPRTSSRRTRPARPRPASLRRRPTTTACARSEARRSRPGRRRPLRRRRPRSSSSNAPTGLTATAMSGSRIDLTWIDNAPTRRALAPAQHVDDFASPTTISSARMRRATRRRAYRPRRSTTTACAR